LVWTEVRDPLEIIITFLTITLATVAFGSLTMGYLACGMNPLEWIIMAVATVILYFPHIFHSIIPGHLPDLAIDGIGIVLWVVVFLLQKARIKADPSLTLPIHEQKKLKAARA